MTMDTEVGRTNEWKAFWQGVIHLLREHCPNALSKSPESRSAIKPFGISIDMVLRHSKTGKEPSMRQVVSLRDLFKSCSQEAIAAFLSLLEQFPDLARCLDEPQPKRISLENIIAFTSESADRLLTVVEEADLLEFLRQESFDGYAWAASAAAERLLRNLNAKHEYTLLDVEAFELTAETFAALSRSDIRRMVMGVGKKMMLVLKSGVARARCDYARVAYGLRFAGIRGAPILTSFARGHLNEISVNLQAGGELLPQWNEDGSRVKEFALQLHGDVVAFGSISSCLYRMRGPWSRRTDVHLRGVEESWSVIQSSGAQKCSSWWRVSLYANVMRLAAYARTEDEFAEGYKAFLDAAESNGAASWACKAKMLYLSCKRGRSREVIEFYEGIEFARLNHRISDELEMRQLYWTALRQTKRWWCIDEVCPYSSVPEQLDRCVLEF